MAAKRFSSQPPLSWTARSLSTTSLLSKTLASVLFMKIPRLLSRIRFCREVTSLIDWRRRPYARKPRHRAKVFRSNEMRSEYISAAPATLCSNRLSEKELSSEYM